MLLLSMAMAQQVQTVEMTAAGLTDVTMNAVPDALAAPVQPTKPAPEVVEATVPTESEVAGFTVDQVFAEEQGLTAATVPAVSTNGFGGSLGWALGIAGLGLAFAGRKFVTQKLNKAPKQERLEVLDRKGLGANSGLMLVEVETTEGGRRRLLVGVGQGSPTLVADLGGDVPGFPDDFMATVDQPAPAVAEPEPEPAVEAPKGRFTGKFTDEDLALDEPAPAKAAKVSPVGGRSRNAALADMARQSKPATNRAPLGKRPFAASPWSKAVDRMPKSPAEAARRLENRKALIADVLKGRAA